DGEADADNVPEIDLGGESPWGFFMNGRASFGDAPRRDRDPGYEFETQGLTAGVDYRLSSSVVLGAALGYLRTDTEVQGGGTTDVEGYSLTGYLTWYGDSWYVDAVIGYGQNDITTERAIELPRAFLGVDRLVAVGEPDSDQLSVHLAYGYDTQIGRATTLTGFVRGSWVRADVDAYTETGALVFDLAYEDQTVESLLGEVGFEVVHPLSMNWGVLQPMVRVSYLHEFEDDPQVLIGRFARDPRARPFPIRGEAPDVDFFNLAAGLTATFPRGWAGYLQYDTDLERDDLDIYTLSGGFRLQF
ncbi:MAG: autotransporter outer membrane beta-barrel domain-containing protein, partial [Acidobacteriota bacterium]